MIREALEYLFTQQHLTERPTTIEVKGRTHLMNPSTGEYREVKPPSCPNLTYQFGTVASLAAYLKRAANPDLATVILYPVRGIVAHLDETDPYRSDVLQVPFFAADLPPDKPLTHEELLLYLDQHTGHVQQEDEVRAVVNFVSVHEGAKLTTRDQGAATRIDLASSKEVRGGETQAVSLPKYLTINLRLGTREYAEPHRFRLLVTDGPRFRLVHLDRDGAMDRFLARCLEDLRSALGEGWHVYQGHG